MFTIATGPNSRAGQIHIKGWFMDGSTLVSRRNRLDSITGARFVAAFLVFIFHASVLSIFSAEAKIGPPFFFVARGAGTLGVSFFFVLSGFVLTWSARPGDTFGRFIRRRVVKLYPNHVVALALAMLLLAATVTAWTSALPSLLLAQAWVPDPQIFLAGNAPSWSLSCELFFYLLFPVLLALVKRIGKDKLWWWAGGVAALIVLVPNVTRLLPATPTFGAEYTGTILFGQPVYSVWFVYIFPPVRLLDFLLGILMARIVLSGNWINVRPLHAGMLTVAAYVAGLFLPLIYSVDAVVIVPVALFIAALAAGDMHGTGSALGTPTMRRLGDASFAFYLVHYTVLVFLRGLVGNSRRLSLVEGTVLISVGFAISLVLALLLHSRVEKAAMRRWSRSPVATPSR